MATVTTLLQTPNRAMASGDGLSIGPWAVRQGYVSASDLWQMAQTCRRNDLSLVETLARSGTVPPDALYDAVCACSGLPPAALDPGPEVYGIAQEFGQRFCAHNLLVPLAIDRGRLVMGTPDPDHGRRALDQMPAGSLPIDLRILSLAQFADILDQLFAMPSGQEALTRVAPAHSCRTLFPDHRSVTLRMGGLGLGLVALTWAIPQVILWGLTWVALGLMLISAALKVIGVAATRRAPSQRPPAPMQRPIVSLMIPLLREAEVVPRLITRLSQITYPKSLLDICLVVEADDTPIHAALATAALPSHMRVITVPSGPVQTKPRALSYALPHCRGQVIGIYDAEDTPDPDQVADAVAQLAGAGPQVACVQARLDFGAPRGWLARCFAIEYAVWFRVMLPALQALGWPLPLGGTSLFFRRDVLDRIGGWDPYNVTEDADLGLRLARFGYRTELLDSTTLEEPTHKAWPWVKQRARWLKGYALTAAVLLRDPVGLWRQVGAWQMLGIVTLMALALLGPALLPLMVSFWVVSLGLPHSGLTALPFETAQSWLIVFLGCEAMGLIAAAWALSRTGRARLIPIAPSTHFYFPLSTLALIRAVWDILVRPFYWDKTDHVLDVEQPIPPSASGSGRPTRPRT